MQKIVLVTGGNSGIGFACIKYFFSRGMQVIATGRRKIDTLTHLEEQDKAILEKVDYQVMDVAKQKILHACFITSKIHMVN